MKKNKQSPTRSKSARHNGRASNDTNRRNPGNPSEDGFRFYVSMPAGAFERIAAKVAELEKRKTNQKP